MKIINIKSSLKKALDAESYLYRARCKLLQECQNCCEDKLDDCEYQPSDGFCLTYATKDFDCNQISVTTFIELASKSKRRLKLSDFEYLC